MVLAPERATAIAPLIDPDALGTGIARNRSSNGHATHIGSAFAIDVMLQVLGLPDISGYRFGRLLGFPNPLDGYRPLNGKSALSGFYMARLSYLVSIKAMWPEYWTPERLLSEVDWHVIHLHQYALPVRKQLLARFQRGSRRQDGLSPSRQGVRRYHQSKAHRPLASG